MSRAGRLLRRTALLRLAGVIAMLSAASVVWATTVPVPAQCTPTVNAGMVQFIAAQQSGSGNEAYQDNVMVCGTALRNAIPQHAGHSGTGAHHVLVLSVPTQQGLIVVEVVTNDQLDGVVSAQKNDPVIAFGQAFFDGGGMRAAGFAVSAGLHEPHCATHAGADDGWIVVAGKRYPKGSCSGAP